MKNQPESPTVESLRKRAPLLLGLPRRVIISVDAFKLDSGDFDVYIRCIRETWKATLRWLEKWVLVSSELVDG